MTHKEARERMQAKHRVRFLQDALKGYRGTDSAADGARTELAELKEFLQDTKPAKRKSS